MPNTTGFIVEGAKKAKKTRDITLHSVWGPGVRSPLKPEIFTPAGEAAARGWVPRDKCFGVIVGQVEGDGGGCWCWPPRCWARLGYRVCGRMMRVWGGTTCAQHLCL